MESDIKIFVRFLKDESIYNMFQTEVIRQCVFVENLSKTIVLENYDMYKVASTLLSYKVNPLARMMVWRETRQGVEFWRNKRDKLGNLLRESLKNVYIRCSQSY